MDEKILALSEDLRASTTLDDFWDRVIKELNNFGVTSILYAVAGSKVEVEQKGFERSLFWKSNHPSSFFELFDEGAFLENDLTASSILKTPDTIIWHNETLWENATKKEIAQSDAERDMGLFAGITIPNLQFSSNGFGGIGISTGELIPIEFDKMWEEKQDYIMQILALLDMGMKKHHLSSIIAFSKREQEVMTWLASGLRPLAIADRLGIGYRTVDKYIVSARKKLNATTTNQAVAKAIMFNVIQP